MSELTASTQPPAALRIALVGAIRRRRSRIRVRASVAVATGVAVVAALFGGVFAGGPEPVLAIDDNGGEWVTVQILDGDAGAAEMTRELQDAGFDAEVRALPTTPDQVGRWMGVALGVDPTQCDLPERVPNDVTCATPPVLDAMRGIRFADDVLRIPSDKARLLESTHVIFYLGREPEAGEHAVLEPPRSVDMEFAYPAIDTTRQADRPVRP